MSDNTVI